MNRMAVLGRALRNRPTEAEELLWKHLRLKQMEGFNSEGSSQLITT